ncbi:catecholate siderophore receptor Fiu [Novosphingobium sp. 9]|uniref:catecholate siderophore receptor Fiu n=1 Tax=Novosphingobium sp. 9 TaxID=2025349 RepID=UPI0021B56258|nr:catecholate siderophore receptor Fiu [Novosphingobium sp. 9]
MSLARLRESLASGAPAYLALSCFGMAATPALAQQADEPSETNATRLQGVTVSDSAVDDSIKVDHVASPKFTQPLQDTPQTIQVINKTLFNQQGATTLAEALRNTPGVGTFYAGENGTTSSGDAIRMRGFDTSNSIYVDGVRDIGSVSRDIFNTEQVEVTKGPAGTDNGRSAPTGAINMVTKRANLDQSISGIASVGVDNQKRANVDVNMPLTALPNTALRVNAVWQDSDVPGRDHVNNSHTGLAASLGTGLGTATRVYLNVLHVDQNNVPDGFVPTIGLPGFSSPGGAIDAIANRPVDSSNFYGTRQDHDDVKANMATLIAEHDFSDSVKLTNTARWGKTSQDYLLTSFMSTAANVTYNAATDTYYLARSNPTIKDISNRILTDQLNLRADFATGPVQHNLSAGLEITSEKQLSYAYSTSGAAPLANLYDPDWDDTGSTYLYSRNGGISRGQTDTYSAYLFDTAKFLNDMVLVTGGVRVDHYKTDYFSSAACGGTGRGAVTCPTGSVAGDIVTTADLSKKGTLFNWKLGVVVKPVEPVSVYVNYAISQQPPGGDAFTLSASSTAANGIDGIKPQKAKTIEGGVKWSALDGRLAVNAAVFQTKVDNEIDSTDLDDIQSGSKRVRGFELSAIGNVTDAWSIMLGYSHQKTKVTSGPVVNADGSSSLAYQPDDSFTSWTTYRLPFGLELGGGVRYMSGMKRGTDGAVGTPAYTKGYTVVDAIVSYALTDNIKLRVNAYNLFDKDYVAAINKSGYRYTPGTPQTFLFSADFNF